MRLQDMIQKGETHSQRRIAGQKQASEQIRADLASKAGA
jgi:hypothetical protein